MNKKNWLLLILACAVAFTSFNSCKKDNDDDSTDTGPTEWTKSVVFKNAPRSGAASFTIAEENKAYVVGGYVNPTVGISLDGAAFNGTAWSNIADFTGPARHEAVGFAVGGKGYVGTGQNLQNELFKDFYAYNPSTNSWTEVAEFPGEARHGAVAFSLGQYGYVGLGRNVAGQNLGDMYRYNPMTDSWTEMENLPFVDKTSYAFSFVIGDKAYVGGGYTNSNDLPDGFYSFDGTNWKTLNSLNRSDDSYTYDARKQRASTFVIGNYGYVVSGKGTSGSVTSTVWKYEPSTDSWTDKHQALTKDAREKAAGFSIDGKGYVVTGVSGSTVFDNMYQFTPVR
ncbi:Kelch repeat-containing protein [Sphingobacterium sp. LRF_L2]|uniref:Kelch repeat-containing protein n=1 Tax=Sphingobacterium sp. LRF_L2 TaxID=3369421 RepID=UPI003F60DF0B